MGFSGTDIVHCNHTIEQTNLETATDSWWNNDSQRPA